MKIKLFSIFISSLLLFTCIFFFTTCQKEYYKDTVPGGVVTPPPPTPAVIAAFTLSGSPNECENAVINGTYISAKPLTSSNNVEVNVNVTAPGAYSIKTDTIDGISFSASGTFTGAGNQKVTLKGSGTPNVPANLVFTPLAGTSNCTFFVTVVNPQPLATYVLESGAGSPNPCTYAVSGNYISSTPLSASHTVSIRVFVTVVGNFTIATGTVNGMMFSYTGAFTTPGAQQVQLKGSGMPVNKGVFTFIPQIVGPHPLGGEACAFDITVN